MNEKHLFLESAHVEDYRSIRKTDITFQAGLNIIIGKNGSGKSNFLNCIYHSATGNSKFLLDVGNISLVHKGKNKWETKYKRNFIVSPPSVALETTFAKNNEIIAQSDENISGHFIDIYNTEERGIHTKIIKYSYPENIASWSVPIDATYSYKNELTRITSFELFQLMFEAFSDTAFFETNFTSTLRRQLIGHDLSLSADNLELHFRTIAEKTATYLADKLKLVSKIENIRLFPQFNLGINSKRIWFNSLFFEFKINGEWFRYEQLSDGEKRIIYLISEITTYDFDKTNGNNDYEIILIEEPELGIHPHQLNQLMTFLKEESETKQIIITTHSPVVLDILNKDELDRIIISEYTPEKGSTFRHMTEEEKAEAKDYMKDLGYLSYYWRFSDFNRI